MNPAISSFLFFGYCPRPIADLAGGLQEALAPGARRATAAVDRGVLVDEGVAQLRRLFESPGPGPHVVPLSGGLDSRAVLGGLIDAGARDQCTAITIGTPGTMDYDFAAVVARTLNVQHVAVDLTRQEVTRDALREASRHTAAPINVFEAFFLGLIPARFGRTATYWSGFVGDVIAGSYCPADPSRSWDEARHRFIAHNRAAPSVALADPAYRPEQTVAGAPVFEPDVLDYDEQLVLTVRQECYTRPLLVPPDYTVRTPFVDPCWMRFLFGIPRALRVNQRLYKAILRKADPRSFALPDKTSMGLALSASAPRRWLHRQALRAATLGRTLFGDRRTVDPRFNYIDFGSAIRNRSDMREVVTTAIRNLAERRVLAWLDPRQVLERHLAGTADHAAALQVLTSLDIHLETGRLTLQE